MDLGNFDLSNGRADAADVQTSGVHGQPMAVLTILGWLVSVESLSLALHCFSSQASQTVHPLEPHNSGSPHLARSFSSQSSPWMASSSNQRRPRVPYPSPSCGCSCCCESLGHWLLLCSTELFLLRFMTLLCLFCWLLTLRIRYWVPVLTGKSWHDMGIFEVSTDVQCKAIGIITHNIQYGDNNQ